MSPNSCFAACSAFDLCGIECVFELRLQHLGAVAVNRPQKMLWTSWILFVTAWFEWKGR